LGEIVGGEDAAGERRDAEQIEERSSDGLPGDALRGGAGAGEYARSAGNRGHRGEDLILIVPIGKVEGRDAVMDVAGGVLPQHGEFVGMGKGERAEDHGVDQAEDGAVGSDADGEDGDGDERESGRLTEDAGGVAKVLHE
jgi:hypothetical protein